VVRLSARHVKTAHERQTKPGRFT